MQITPEDKTLSISYENAFKLTGNPIIAISHIITPNDEHVTKMFYLNGETHTAFGFALGEIEGDAERHARILGLILAIQTIWNVDMGSIMKHLSSFGNESFEDGKNIIYHFTAPSHKEFSYISDSSGMFAFVDSVNFLDEEGKHNIRMVE